VLCFFVSAVAIPDIVFYLFYFVFIGWLYLRRFLAS